MRGRYNYANRQGMGKFPTATADFKECLMKSGLKLVSACVVGAALASGVYFGGMALADEAKTAAPAAVQAPAAPVVEIAKPVAEAQDVVATLAADAQFSKLSGLIAAAGLAEILKSAPAATVFAPTDAAFAALPKETADALVKDPAKVKALLLDHVVLAKSLKTADIAKEKAVKVASGSELAVVVKDNALVTVGGAKVVKADIAVKNGVVQAIDKLVVASVPAATVAPVAPAVTVAPAAPVAPAATK